MRVQFPALCHALGQNLFDDFTADYVHRHPPESHTLHDLGRRFAGFLEEQRLDRGQPAAARARLIDFMIDLARFERQLFLLYDAPGAEGGTPAYPDIPDQRVGLQPAVALGRFRFASPTITMPCGGERRRPCRLRGRIMSRWCGRTMSCGRSR